MRRREFLRTTAAAAAGSALAWGGAFRGASAAGAPQRGGTLRVGWIPNAHTLDPHYSVDFAERHVMYAVYNTLVAVSPSFEILPELARSWKIEPNGKVITFQLQPGVKFHDGTPCDSAAVKWNIDFMLDAANNSPQRRQIEPFIAGVDATGPAAVVFHLKAPWPGLLAALAERPGFMASPAAWQKFGKDLGRHPVGTGPFEFVEWVSDDHVTLKRFGGYWDKGKPYLDGIVYRVIPDPAVRGTMVRTGEIDTASSPDPKDIPGLEHAPNVKVITENPSGHWWATQWRVDRPPFNNKALRQAIAHGIDRDEFVKVMLGGRGTVAKGPTPSNVWWYNDSVKGLTYDPVKAKSLLAEAGHAGGFSAEFATDNTPLGLQFAELLQQQLKKINVNITINPVNPADMYQQVLAAKLNWSRTDWTLRGDPDGLLRILFYTGNFANSTSYSGVDRLLTDASSTYDRAIRKKVYGEIEQTVINDAPYVWIMYVPEYEPTRTPVQDFVWIPDSVPRYRDLWITK